MYVSLLVQKSEVFSVNEVIYLRDIYSADTVPPHIKTAVNEFFGDEEQLKKIVIGHVHKWDGGYICKNGYISTCEDFCCDLNQMLEIFTEITERFGANEITVFPFDKCFFEHWADVMEYDISKEINRIFKDNQINAQNCLGIRLNAHHSLVRLLISGAFNYLIQCVFSIGNSIVIIPTHNFEFCIYCCKFEDKLLEIARKYPFADLYDSG